MMTQIERTDEIEWVLWEYRKGSKEAEEIDRSVIGHYVCLVLAYSMSERPNSTFLIAPRKIKEE